MVDQPAAIGTPAVAVAQDMGIHHRELPAGTVCETHRRPCTLCDPTVPFTNPQPAHSPPQPLGTPHPAPPTTAPPHAASHSADTPAAAPSHSINSTLIVTWAMLYMILCQG